MTRFTYGKTRNAYTFLAGGSHGYKGLGKTKRRSWNDIKNMLLGTSYEDIN